MFEVFRKINISLFIKQFACWFILFFSDIWILYGWSLSLQHKEWAYLFIQPCCYAFFAIGVCSLFHKCRFVAKFLFSYVFLIEVVELFLQCKFNSYFTGDLLLIALNSSFSEVLSFAKAMFEIKLLLGLCAIMLCYVFAIRNIGRLCVERNVRFVFSAIMCVPFIVFNFIVASPKNLDHKVLATWVISDSVESFKQNSELYRACKSPGILGDFTVQDSVRGVLVIGESVTRNQMGVYGYARETTPWMSAHTNELFVFTDLITSWNNTQGALRHLLTETSFEDPAPICSLVEVAKQAGYECSLFSNQGHWGTFETLDALLFNACATKFYQKENGGGYDQKLISKFSAWSRVTTNRNAFAVLHMSGSHWETTPRSYPKESEKFPPDTMDKITSEMTKKHRIMYNCYDNTVLAADDFFASVIAELEQRHDASFAIFISDHGETPRTGKMRRNGCNDLWEIPMVIWLSKEYKQRFPDVEKRMREARDLPIQSDQLFTGLLTMLQITGYRNYDSRRDFASKDFVVRPVRLIDNGKRAYLRHE